MELMTKEIRNKIPKMTETAEQEDPRVYVKFFYPLGSWTWYGMEFDGDDLFYGYVDGDYGEYGYFTLSELQSFKDRFGLGIERDKHWDDKTTMKSILGE
tara:strand:- start:432 stop:728 length:297 start_codon:yes stop_codon:yes gene_type:complete